MLQKTIPSFNLQSFLDSHDKPFVLIDESYTIVGANSAYCAYYDTSPNAIIGSKCHMIHHRSELPCHSFGEDCPMLKVMETGNEYEVCHLHHNREFYAECVSIKGFPITDENGNRYLAEEILGEEIVQAAITSDATENNTIKSLEAKYIEQLLVEHNGNCRKVAEILKISERMLRRKLMNYNLINASKCT